MNDPAPAVTDRDVYITRAFNAPREVVWKFFTEPGLIARWFGPHIFSVPADTVRVEAHEGGAYALTMVGVETGERAPMLGRISRIEPPEYLELVLEAHSSDVDLEDVILRLQFHDHGDRTRVTLHQGPFTTLDRDLTEQGWGESFEKLDAVLTEEGR
jgi:uncharacterized protein YndB with AHSA1/START domain